METDGADYGEELAERSNRRLRNFLIASVVMLILFSYARGFGLALLLSPAWGQGLDYGTRILVMVSPPALLCFVMSIVFGVWRRPADWTARSLATVACLVLPLGALYLAFFASCFVMRVCIWS